jgi:hypothetical protein
MKPPLLILSWQSNLVSIDGPNWGWSRSVSIRENGIRWGWKEIIIFSNSSRPGKSQAVLTILRISNESAIDWSRNMNGRMLTSLLFLELTVTLVLCRMHVLVLNWLVVRITIIIIDACNNWTVVLLCINTFQAHYLSWRSGSPRTYYAFVWLLLSIVLP